MPISLERSVLCGLGRVRLANFFVREDAAGAQQRREPAVAMAELIEAAFFDDTATVQEQDLVCFPNSRKTVRDDEGRPVLAQVVDCRLNLSLIHI